MKAPTYPLKDILSFRVLDVFIKDMWEDDIIFQEFKDFSNNDDEREILLPANFFEINEVGIGVHLGVARNVENVHMDLLWCYHGFKVFEQNFKLGPIARHSNYCWKNLIKPGRELALMKNTFPDVKGPEELNGHLRIFFNIYEGDDLITQCAVRFHFNPKN